VIARGLYPYRQPILSPEQLATLDATSEKEPFDGDAAKFCIGIEAMRFVYRLIVYSMKYIRRQQGECRLLKMFAIYIPFENYKAASCAFFLKKIR
jgi:hypothetical protein